MKQVLGVFMKNTFIDTWGLCSWLGRREIRGKCFTVPSVPDLYKLAACMEIPVIDEHNAAGDAFLTAQLFQRLLPLLREGGIATVGELADIGDPFQGGDRFRVSGEMPHF